MVVSLLTSREENLISIVTLAELLSLSFAPMHLSTAPMLSRRGKTLKVVTMDLSTLSLNRERLQASHPSRSQLWPSNYSVLEAASANLFWIDAALTSSLRRLLFV
jgi:hypothetical protein